MRTRKHDLIKSEINDDDNKGEAWKQGSLSDDWMTDMIWQYDVSVQLIIVRSSVAQMPWLIYVPV